MYNEKEIKERFGVPNDYIIDLTKEFGVEVDREGLQLCDSNLYSTENFEIVEEQSKSICSNYDLWYRLFDVLVPDPITWS